MKKILFTFLCAISVAACGGESNTDDSTGESNDAILGMDANTFGSTIKATLPHQKTVEESVAVKVSQRPAILGSAFLAGMDSIAQLEFSANHYHCSVTFGLYKDETTGQWYGNPKAGETCTGSKGQHVGVTAGGLNVLLDHSKMSFSLFLDDGASFGAAVMKRR